MPEQDPSPSAVAEPPTESAGSDLRAPESSLPDGEPAAPDPGYCIGIDPEGLSATLRLEPCTPPHAPDALLRALSEDEGLEGLLPEEIERLCARQDGVEAVEGVVARGTPPEPGEDGRLEWLGDFFESHALTRPDGSVDFYHHTRSGVFVGQPLARLLPPTPGRAGRDVKGRRLKAEPGRPLELELDDTVRWAGEEGQSEILAAFGGRVEWQDGRLSIVELLELPAVDFASGSVDFDGAVRVAGEVQDGFELRARGSVSVGGMVGMAELEAGGDLELLLGVMGRGKASLSVGGHLHLVHARETRLRCRGDLVARGELLWCDGKVGGSLHAMSGRIVGGRWRVGDTLHVGELGSGAEVSTLVEVGHVAAAGEPLRKLTRERKRAVERARAFWETHRGFLLERVAARRLPERELAAHRERLLLLRTEAERLWRRELAFRRVLRARRLGATVLVTGAIHPGVRLVVAGGRAQLSVRRRIDGPVIARFCPTQERIVLKKVSES